MSSDRPSFHPSRRRFLAGGISLAFAPFLPRMALAAGGRDRRLVVVVLRGGLDGLTAVAPLGDPDYQALRPGIALSTSDPVPPVPLDGFFGLHPALANVAALYHKREALIVHAVATPYRERSHFDGQDVLESGLAGPGHTESGWLARLIEALPRGAAVGRHGGLAVGATTPVILRGPIPVLAWAPPRLPEATDDLAMRLIDLYAQRDPMLAASLSAAVETDRLATNTMDNEFKPFAARRYDLEAAVGAARLMTAADGPRIASLTVDGWDTHVKEGGATGRLAGKLGILDRVIGELSTHLAPVWADTTIVCVTEFGRTARVNGTGGTDHGTGSITLVAGGAVAGGRVVGDWPGLSATALHQNRDLAPTTALWSVLKGVLGDLYDLDETTLATRIFPDSAALRPLRGLIRTS